MDSKFEIDLKYRDYNELIPHGLNLMKRQRILGKFIFSYFDNLQSHLKFGRFRVRFKKSTNCRHH